MARGYSYGQASAQQTVNLVNRALVAQIRELSGADSDAVKAAASVLRKSIRTTLSTPGADRHASLKTRRVRGTPSTPGAPPAMQSGRLSRSVRTAVVSGVRRVGFNDFRARLLEFGAVQAAAPSHPYESRNRSGKPRKTARAMTKAKKAIVIAPRPFMERSLSAAQPKMAEVVVGPLSKLGGK